jgi:hypothetical protein
MKKQFMQLLIPMFILSHSSSSQTQEFKSPFVSGNLGCFVTSLKDFSKVYDSNIGFAFGGGVGLPLSSRTYLYGKATYFLKSGVPVIYTYSYQNGTIVSVTESRDGGTATFHQWIFNGGIHYNFFLSEEFTLGVDGGLTYAKISETMQSATATLSSTLDAAGALGFFAGLGLERNFSQSPFTVFAEAQYNYIRHDILTAVGNYGGANLTFGLRYYFKERRRL